MKHVEVLKIKGCFMLGVLTQIVYLNSVLELRLG